MIKKISTGLITKEIIFIPEHEVMNMVNMCVLLYYVDWVAAAVER